MNQSWFSYIAYFLLPLHEIKNWTPMKNTYFNEQNLIKPNLIKDIFFGNWSGVYLYILTIECKLFTVIRSYGCISMRLGRNSYFGVGGGKNDVSIHFKVINYLRRILIFQNLQRKLIEGSDKYLLIMFWFSRKFLILAIWHWCNIVWMDQCRMKYLSLLIPSDNIEDQWSQSKYWVCTHFFFRFM